MGAQPVAARVALSCLRPERASARAGQATTDTMSLGGKADAFGEPLSGKLHGQGCGFVVVRVNSDLPLARHPGGLPDAGRPVKQRALNAPTTARQNRSLPPEGMTRGAPLCGVRPSQR